MAGVDILCGLGALLQAPLQGAPHVRGIAGRPGSFDEGMSSLGVPRLGDCALVPPRTAGGFRGNGSGVGYPQGILPLVPPHTAGGFRGRQAHVPHERSGVVNAPLSVS
jgi:hypothetical protein